MEIQSEQYLEAQKLVHQIKVSNIILGEELQGDLYRAQNNFTAAIETYQALWQKNATNEIANKIYPLLNTGNNKNAQSFLSEWLNKIPNSTDALNYQANEYLIAEDYKKAVVILEQIDRQQPNSAINLNNLAWCYQQLDHPAALETAKRAYELAPDHASIGDTYGWILYKADKVEDAKIILEKALELDPKNEEIRHHIEKMMAATNN